MKGDAGLYSPVLDGSGNLYVSSIATSDPSQPTVGGYLYCLDATTGKRRWAFPTGGWVSGVGVSDEGTAFGSADGALYMLK